MGRRCGSRPVGCQARAGLVWTEAYPALARQFVRNLGCMPEVAGTVWCRIQRISDAANQDWASARYLEPSRDPGGGATHLSLPVSAPGEGATQLPGDALEPGTGYNLTETLACTVSCRATTAASASSAPAAARPRWRSRCRAGSGDRSCSRPGARKRGVHLVEVINQGRPCCLAGNLLTCGRWQKSRPL